MTDRTPRTPSLFLDDGHPEARDYVDNYVVLDAPAPRELWQRLFAIGANRPRREALPPRTRRIESAGEPIGA